MTKYLRSRNYFPEKVLLEEAQEDVNILFCALQSAYSGYDFFGGENAFNKCENTITYLLNQAITDEKGNIRNKGVIRKELLEEILGEQLEKIICDFHFSIGNYPFAENNIVYMYYVPGYYFSADSIPASLQSYIKQTITPEGDISYCFAALSSTKEGLPSTAFIDNNEVNLDWIRAECAEITNQDRAFGETTVNSIQIITSRTMAENSKTIEQLERFSQCGETYRKSNIIIIDLRGNGGGNSMYEHEFLNGYLGTELVTKHCSAQKCSRLWVATLEKLENFFDQEVEVIAEEIESIKANIGKWKCDISNGEVYENDNTIFVLVDKKQHQRRKIFL